MQTQKTIGIRDIVKMSSKFEEHRYSVVFRDRYRHYTKILPGGADYWRTLQLAKEGSIPSSLEDYKQIPHHHVKREIAAKKKYREEMPGYRVQRFEHMSKEGRFGWDEYRNIVEHENNAAHQAREEIEYFEDMYRYLPVVSSLHGSYGKFGLTFRESNKDYWPKYDGYHVSDAMNGMNYMDGSPIYEGEKILFPLPKKLPDAQGKEIIVADAKDHIILANLEVETHSVQTRIGPFRISREFRVPTIEYEYNRRKKLTIVHVNENNLKCVPFIPYPSDDDYYELKNGSFVKSPVPLMGFHISRLNENWNGFFSLDSAHHNAHLFSSDADKFAEALMKYNEAAKTSIAMLTGKEISDLQTGAVVARQAGENKYDITYSHGQVNMFHNGANIVELDAAHSPSKRFGFLRKEPLKSDVRVQYKSRRPMPSELGDATERITFRDVYRSPEDMFLDLACGIHRDDVGDKQD